MACGLPVVVTSVAGCAADLVENEWNGYIVPPTDPYALKVAIERLARGNEVRQQMSVRSYERIRGILAAGLRQRAGRCCVDR